MPTTYDELDKSNTLRGRKIMELEAEYARLNTALSVLEARNARLRLESNEDLAYLLGVIDNGKQFTLPILKGCDPTFYATLSYEGDLAIAQRIEEIRGRVG
jgi:hypothetical protein